MSGRALLRLALVAAAAIAAATVSTARAESNRHHDQDRRHDDVAARVVAGDLIDIDDDRLDRSFDIAHDSVTGRYLAVWRDFDGFADRGVLGALLQDDGTVDVGPFEIAVQMASPTEILPDSFFSPRVEYNASTGQYAVVFLRNSDDAAIADPDRRSALTIGRLVSSDGELVGDEVPLNPPLGSAGATSCVPRYPDLAADSSTGGFVLVYARTYASPVDLGDVCDGLQPAASVTTVQVLDGSLARGARVDFPVVNSGGPAEPGISHDALSGTTLVTQPFEGVDETGPGNRDGLRFAAQVYSGDLDEVAPVRTVDVDPVEPSGTGPVDVVLPVADLSGGWIVVSSAPFFGPAWTNQLGPTGEPLRIGNRLDGRPTSVAAAGDGTFVFTTEAGTILHVRADGSLVHPAPLLPPSILSNAAVALAPPGGDGSPTVGVAVGIGPDGVVSTALRVVPPGVLPVAPARLLETRSSSTLSTIDGRFEGTGQINSESFVAVEVVGRGGVPADAEAVVLNIAATGAAGDGFVTAYPCDADDRPLTANLNYTSEGAASAGALTPVAADGTVCLFSSRSTDLVVDVNGYVPAGGSVDALVPARLFETRTGPGVATFDGQFDGVGRIGAGSVVPFQVSGRAGVPDGAEAVVVNVAAIRPSVGTFLTVFPCDEVQPLAANLNAARDTIVNNLVTAKLAADGRLCVFTSGTTDLIVDVAAAVPLDGGLRAVVPARLTETRSGAETETVDGEEEGIGRVDDDSTTVIQVAGRGGVADDATGAMLNVAAIRPSSGGFFTVFPCDAAERPLAANLNFGRSQIVSNAVFAALSDDGTACVYSTAETDLTVDVVGFVVDD